jgi:hypothetical protein
LQRFVGIFAEQPVASFLIFGVMAMLAALAIFSIWRSRGRFAFWCVVGIILLDLTISFGEDITPHVYRIIALKGQVRAGHFTLLLTDPNNGEALPTFVYYSLLPYLPAIALNLLGLSAHAAFKIALGAELLVMALGLRQLVQYVARDVRSQHTAYLSALLFLCVNYVYSLWIVRMAFAEIWVYCLIPWVVLAMMQQRSLVALIGLLFLQIAGHPVVFAHA